MADSVEKVLCGAHAQAAEAAQAFARAEREKVEPGPP